MKLAAERKETYPMTTEAKNNPPVFKDHVGNVHFAIWKQSADKDGKTSNFYKATFEVRYKKGDTWKSTDNYSLRDLQNLWKANALAHSAILKLVQGDKDAAPEMDAEAE